MPDGLTPHSLRRTFASVLLTLSEPVPYVMEQMGHTDPKVTLGIYARAMRRDEGEQRALGRLVGRGGDATSSVAARDAQPSGWVAGALDGGGYSVDREPNVAANA